MKKNFLPPFIIFLLGLLPIVYFRDKLLIFGGDHGLWILNPAAQIYRDLFLWNTRGIEEYQPYSPLLIPYLIILRLFELLKIPNFLSEAILLSFLFAAAGLSMYFLVTSLLNGQRKLVAFSAAIFYMLNPYNIINWAIPQPVPLASYAFYPLMLAFFIRGLNSEKGIFRSAIIFGLGSLILVTGNFAPSFLLITYFTIVLYLIFFLLTAQTKEKKIRALKFSLLGMFIVFLLNIWWITPLLKLYNEGVSWFATSTMSLEWSVQNYSKYTSFLHLFQLFGWPSWGTDTFGYDKAYVENPILIILSFLPIFLVITGLILLKSEKINFHQKDRTIFLFFTFLLLLAMFLAKGAHPPLANFNWWLYKFIPFFAIFRTGFLKLGIILALSLSILFGLSLEILYRKTRHRWVIFAIIALLLIYNYPFFTGGAILAEKSFNNSSVHHHVPSYYLEASRWINDQAGNFKIMTFPAQGNWEVYKWDNNERYIGVDVLNELVNKTIKHAYVAGDLIKTSIYDSFYRRKTDNIEKALGLSNIKYLLLRNEVDPEVFGNLPPEYIKTQLDAQLHLKLEKTFGPLDFYRLDDEYFLPQIYIAKTTTYVLDDEFDLHKFTSFDDFQLRSAIYFANDIRIKDKKWEILNKDNTVYISANLVSTEFPKNPSVESFFPYVRLTPDHILYSYILWKEGTAEEKEKENPSALADLKMTHASKRVVEVEKLVNNEKFDFIEPTLKRYEEKINELFGLLREEEQKGSLPSGILAKMGIYLEKQKYFLQSLLHRLPPESQRRVEETVAKIEKIGVGFFGKQSAEEKDQRVIYEFTIPKDGDYSIYLGASDLKKYLPSAEVQLSAELHFTSGEIEQVKVDLRKENGRWILLKERALAEGTYYLYFDTIKTHNLFSKDLVQVDSAPTGSGSISLSIPSFHPDATYKISFDYKNERGVQPRFSVYQIEGRDLTAEELDELGGLTLDFPSTLMFGAKESPGEEEIEGAKINFGPSEKFDKDFGWQHYESVFEVNPRTEFLRLAFFADLPKDAQNPNVVTTNFYSGIKVERLFTNQVILKSQNANPVLKTPDINFVKIDPTKYRVKIENATDSYTLIFSEAFHPDWKAYIVEEKGQTMREKLWETWFQKSLPEQNHYLVNGYGNAWRIEKPGNYEIVLEFWPQRLFYIGLIITGLSIIFALGYFIYERNNNSS